MKRLRRSVFLYVEDELQAYHETLRELETLPERIGVALEVSRRQERMQSITRSIGSVVEGLSAEKLELVRLMYWSRPRRYTWDGLAMQINVTRRTAFRWRREILCAIATRAGLA